jgi:hypothetical protein
MTAASKGTAVVTGASNGIGAVYADRLARRGHDLVLVARNRDRLDALARRLSKDTGRTIRVVVADLGSRAGVRQVEALLRSDTGIAMLVNNAGVGATAALLDSDIDKMEEMIDLNVTALTRLTYAAVPGFVERGGGTVINIASAVGIRPEVLNGVYGATKSYVIGFSQSLRHELANRHVRVQVVCPGVTATDFWPLAGTPVEVVPQELVMTAENLVDAALAALDNGEFVTLPSLEDARDWEAFEAARQNLSMEKLSRREPARRFGTAQIASA